MAETIDLTDTARLRIEPDEDATNPREDWHMLTGFVNLPNRGDSRRADVPAVHEPPAPIAEAHDRFDTASYRWVPGARSFTNRPGWPRDRTEVTVRWARIFHGLTIEYDSEHGGYWFVDPKAFTENWQPATYVEAAPYAIPKYRYRDELLTKPEVEAQIIQSEQETYRQWADGEVSGVILERLVTHATFEVTRVNDHDGFEIDDLGSGVLSDDWEEAESIWGCYLDDDYTPQVVAGEHFDLTDEEQAALS